MQVALLDSVCLLTETHELEIDAPMTTENEPVNRRGFLKGAALVTAAAVTGGGAAALLNRRPGPTTITAVEPPTPLPPIATPQTLAVGGNNQELLARLAAAQADNMRLQAELAAAQSRLSALEASGNDSAQAQAALQEELAAANNRAGLLAGLVALYEDLDQLDLGDAVQNGLGAVGEVLDEITGRIPFLEEGLASGTSALDEFDAHLPAVVAAREWLVAQVDRLESFYQAAEQVLANVLEAAGDFFQMLADWFADVLKWVPFGMGQRAVEVATALTTLLNETPHTIEGLRRNVAAPLEPWLAHDGEDLALRQKMVKPLREQALAPAGELAGGVRRTQERFQTDLAEPVAAVAARRKLIKDVIVQYRELHQV